MMTYEWFKITQQKHIKDVVLPKPVYHPYKPEGYSFLEFLAANWDVGPIFLCGGCGTLSRYNMTLTCMQHPIFHCGVRCGPSESKAARACAHCSRPPQLRMLFRASLHGGGQFDGMRWLL